MEIDAFFLLHRAAVGAAGERQKHRYQLPSFPVLPSLVFFAAA